MGLGQDFLVCVRGGACVRARHPIPPYPPQTFREMGHSTHDRTARFNRPPQGSYQIAGIAILNSGGITCTEGSIMARPRLPVVLHLSPDEIARRYRTCRTGVEKTHWQVLWLLTRTAEPPTPAQVASQVGLTPAWVRTVLKRRNAQVPEGLAGHPPLT